MLSTIPDRPVPYVFERFNTPSSFLVNFWENLGVIIVSVVVWLSFIGIQTLAKNNPRIVSLAKRGKIMAQNFLIATLYGVYGDLVMFSIVEYRTLVLGWNLTILSLIISVSLWIAMALCFWYQINLLLSYQKIKNSNNSSPKELENFKEANEGNQVLFKEFKDHSLMPQLFLIFLSARDLLFSFMLAIMFEHPLAQTILKIILDLLMIGYLFLKKPFESTFDFIQQICFELLGLIVSITVLINAALDAGEHQAVKARYNIGKLLIIVNMIFNFMTAAFMLIAVIKVIYEVYKGYQQKQQANKHKVIDLVPIKASATSFNISQDYYNSVKYKSSLNSERSLIRENISTNPLETLSFPQRSSDLSMMSPLPSEPQIYHRRNGRVRDHKRAPSLTNEPRDFTALIQRQLDSYSSVYNINRGIRGKSHSNVRVYPKNSEKY